MHYNFLLEKTIIVVNFIKSHKVTTKLLVILSICTSLQAFCKDEITWLKPGFTPAFINKGEFINQGYNDLTINYLISKLSQYEHKTMEVNITRVLSLLKSKEKVVSIGFVKRAEREKYLLYSSIPMTGLQNRVIFFNDNILKIKPHLNEFNQLSFTKIINDLSLVFGHVAGRKYSNNVDQIINHYKNQPNIFTRHSDDVTQGLIKMLALKRVDYIIGYPHEVKFMLNQLGITSKVSYVEIEELVQENKTADTDYFYIVFPKNAWGYKVAKDVDDILSTFVKTAEFRSYYERWLDDADKEIYHDRVIKLYQNL